jgi:hypothetical protein
LDRIIDGYIWFTGGSDAKVVKLPDKCGLKSWHWIIGNQNRGMSHTGAFSCQLPSAHERGDMRDRKNLGIQRSAEQRPISTKIQKCRAFHSFLHGIRFNEVGETDSQETRLCEPQSPSAGGMMTDFIEESENLGESIHCDMKFSFLETGLTQRTLTENRAFIPDAFFLKDYCFYPWFSS